MNKKGRSFAPAFLVTKLRILAILTVDIGQDVSC